ncbi:hypothetical protein PFICI_02862 [Pestalotiopsis fici W106-1]|uniref:Uncharacterized protein n=1 Tax=Pestalotiopsis fici (strain W106-1 / CGMCC3.15140) TaxID=1229662 RepID=W3XHD7_PESFW|nr:uncharacterized protein PFICI_02862 [Pestalotiopsis fici W106-1]ETS84837.1 hypothetical protein PFICI_02862 [Pestalotiopsis fici W106-1]
MAPQNRVGKRRTSLFDAINRIEDDSDEQIFALMRQIGESEVASEGFRYHSSATQAVQDRVLKAYEMFLRKLRILPSQEETDQMPEDEKDGIMFPIDENKLLKQLRFFVIFVAQETSGRSADSLSYFALAKYRAALLFWNKQQVGTPNRSLIYNKITESLRYIAKEHGIIKGSLNPNRTEIGLPELRQLIDHDLSTTSYIAVAEGHQLAWCLMRLCCLRPGSIGWTSQDHKRDKKYLVWRDIEIFRGDVAGSFNVTITFRSLKTNFEDLEKANQKAPSLDTVRVTLPSPRSHDHLIFSIPHRLLVIALRRGILAGFDDLDSLLAGTTRQIHFKKQTLDQPVIRAGKARGLGISEDPASAQSLSEYLRTRGAAIGYGEQITSYSIRRRSATDLARQIGRDDARMLMNHDPDSRVLEKYYLNLSGFTDRTSLGLGLTGTEHDQSETLTAENHPLAIGAIGYNNPEAMIKLHGAALNAAMANAMAQHGPITGTSHEKKLTLRRLRYAVKKSLLSDESQKLRETMSTIEHSKRVQMLNNSKMTDLIIETSRLAMEDKAALDDDSNDPLVDEATGFFKEASDHEDSPEEDLESLLVPGDDAVERTVEDEEDGEAMNDSPEILYEILLDGTMSQHQDWKNNPLQYPKCIDDDAVSQKQQV